MKRHFTNFILKLPNHEQTFFFKVIETTKIVQNSTEVANLIRTIVKEIGEHKKAWKILEKEFRNIQFIGCAAHALDLMVKDIIKLYNNEEVVKNADMIVEFFNNHQMTRNLLNTKLTTRIKARWFGSYESFKSLLHTKNDLMTIVRNNKATIVKIKQNLIKAGFFLKKKFLPLQNLKIIFVNYLISVHIVFVLELCPHSFFALNSLFNSTSFTLAFTGHSLD